MPVIHQTGRKAAPASERNTSCYVCGTEVREEWFVHIQIVKRLLHLCSAECALMFFETNQAPAHDHQAKHDYDRAQAAIVQAARQAIALNQMEAVPKSLATATP